MISLSSNETVTTHEGDIFFTYSYVNDSKGIEQITEGTFINPLVSYMLDNDSNGVGMVVTCYKTGEVQQYNDVIVLNSFCVVA